MNDSVIDLVTAEMFRGKNPQENYSSCVIYENAALSEKKQYVQEKQRASLVSDNLYNLIPDNTYRPQIMVAFDLTSTFALSFVTTDNKNKEIKRLKGKRLVESELIDAIFTQMFHYDEYYYRYILSYTEQNKNDLQVKDNIYQRGSEASENTKLQLINRTINNFLTTVDVNRVRNDISSCTLTFRDAPQYTAFGTSTHLFFMDFFPIFMQLFVPMLPFTVWARGRIYNDFYFPLFTGYVTRCTPANDQGYTTFKIEGRCALELARISVENINPAIIQTAETREQEFNYYSKMFYGADHFQIVQALFVGGEVTFDSYGRQSIQLGEPNTKYGSPKIFPIGSFKSSSEESSKNTPDVILDSRAQALEGFDIAKMLKHLRADKHIVTWGYNLTPFRSFGSSSPDMYTANFSNRLEILRSVANNVYFEFYTDGAGNVHYHPMRLSNDYLYYDSFYPATVNSGRSTGTKKVKKHFHAFPFAQVVSDHETTSISKTHNVEELVTYMIVTGVPAVESMTTEAKVINLVGYYRDDDKLTRFGYRRREIRIDMFNNNPTIKDKDGQPRPLSEALAQAMLQYSNGELYTVTGSFIFRPELEIALPLFLKESGEVFYVRSISHSITIGANAATIVNGSFGRLETEPAVDILSYMLFTESFERAKSSDTVVDVSTETGLATSLDCVIPMTLQTEFLQRQYENIEKAINRRCSIESDKMVLNAVRK